MDHHGVINRAILIHGAWKTRFGATIAASRSDLSVAVVAADNGCEFGKWFYSLPTDSQTTEQARKVQELHAAFHAAAARLLATTANEPSTEAQASRQRYLSLSDQLILALREWEAVLAKEYSQALCVSKK